jgi:glycerophosphoryl diester phosphodiesterase
MKWLVAGLAMVAGFLVVAVSPAEAAAGECEQPFEVVNHRGAQNTRDENSIPAITLAARRNQAVELDVRATSDGVLVLMHDAKIDRATTGTGFVADMTYDELQQWRIEEFGSIIPTLDEALQAAAAAPYPVDVYLDVKIGTEEVLAKAAQSIRDHLMTHRTLVTSWTGKMNDWEPDILQQWKPEADVVTVEDVVAEDVESVGLYRRQLSHELVDGVRASGIEVHSRLVSGPQAWDRATRFRIQGALTNQGVGLRDYCTGSIPLT